MTTSVDEQTEHGPAVDRPWAHRVEADAVSVYRWLDDHDGSDDSAEDLAYDAARAEVTEDLGDRISPQDQDEVAVQMMLGGYDIEDDWDGTTLVSFRLLPHEALRKVRAVEAVQLPVRLMPLPRTCTFNRMIGRTRSQPRERRPGRRRRASSRAGPVRRDDPEPPPPELVVSPLGWAA